MITLFENIKHFFTLRFEHGEKINIEYPTSWEHMSAEDFRNICIILSQQHGRKEFIFLALCALAHIRPDNLIKYNPKKLKDNVVFIIHGKSYVIKPAVIAEACGQLEFILDSVGLAPSPFPTVDRKIYGISFGQFFKTDAYMMRYSADDRNEKWLAEAAKALTNGRIRKLLPWQRKGLPIWWNGVKKYLKEKYPYVFKDGDGSGYQDKTQADILQELLSCMNGDRPQENEKILQSDVYSVLFSLNEIYRKNQEKC